MAILRFRDCENDARTRGNSIQETKVHAYEYAETFTCNRFQVTFQSAVPKLVLTAPNEQT